MFCPLEGILEGSSSGAIRSHLGQALRNGLTDFDVLTGTSGRLRDESKIAARAGQKGPRAIERRSVVGRKRQREFATRSGITPIGYLQGM